MGRRERRNERLLERATKKRGITKIREKKITELGKQMLTVVSTQKITKGISGHSDGVQTQETG